MPFSPKDVFWSVHLESLLQSTQERSKNPSSSLLPQAQKKKSRLFQLMEQRDQENTENLLLVIRNLFSFWLWPHPYHTHNLSAALGSFPPFSLLPSGSAGLQPPPGTPAAHLQSTMCSFLVWTSGEVFCYPTAQGDANSGRACVGPSSDLRHPHNSCCKSHVCTFLTAGYAHLCSVLMHQQEWCGCLFNTSKSGKKWFSKAWGRRQTGNAAPPENQWLKAGS